MSAQLTRTESARLTELETTVEHGLETFAEVGLALAEIRESRLYRKTHNRFEDYLRERWELSRSYAHRTIEAAQVAAMLPIGNGGPANEAQARELVPLKDDEMALVDTWRDLKAKHGEAVTAKEVGRAVELRLRHRQQLERRPEHPILPAPPAGQYSVIYADPPWRFGSAWAARGVENHYPTMPLEDIKTMSIPAGPDAALFIWVPASLNPEGLEVITAWGFIYRTQAVWVKDKIGLGSYFRCQHELLLIATRGAMPTPHQSRRPSSVITAPRRRHSEKPDETYELIERMYPGLPYIELFARAHRTGWEAWGNEVPGAVAA